MPHDFRDFDQQAADAPSSLRPDPVDTIIDEVQRRGIINVPVAAIEPNPQQPRKHFDDAALADLTASVLEHGVLQPIIVRRHPEGAGYLIVAGERRWRAARAAGLPKIPALVRDASDHLEVAIIENLQRENLNAIEEAEALLQLKTVRGYTDEMLARVVGKSRQAVNDSIRLNNLPEAIREECRTCGIGTKRQLLSVLMAGGPEEMQAAWNALRSGEVTTVRELHERTAANKPPKPGRPKNFTFLHQNPTKQYRLTITFKKTKVAEEEIREALSDALQGLS